jgi:hypothetical protein
MLQRSMQPTPAPSNTTTRIARQRVTCFSSNRASEQNFGARKEDFASDLCAAAVSSSRGKT